MSRKTPPSRRVAGTRARLAAATQSSVVPARPDGLGQQFAVAAEGGAVLLRGFEAMRNIQLEATRHATDRHAAAAGRLCAACPTSERLAVQTELLRGDVEDATRCWQQLMDEALEIQSELLACATHLVNTEDALSALHLLDA